MRRPISLFALALLFATISAAADEEALSDFYDKTTGFVNSQTNDFVDAYGSVPGTGGAAFTTVFDSFGPGNCGDDWINSSGGEHNIIGGWYAPAILTGIVVLFGIGIINMLGQMLSSPQLIALSKDELFQTGLTFLRVVFLVAMLSAQNVWYGISASTTSDRIYSNVNNANMIDASMAFCRLMVSDMVGHYSVLLLFNTVIHTLYSSTMWFGVTWRAMYSFNLGPVLKPLIDLIGTALQFLSLGIGEWLMHIVTLCMIKKWTWGLLIPVGILLRAFPYTRNAGEALLALMFALAVFYPFMFIFDYEAHKLMKSNLVDSHKAVSGFLAKSGILKVVGGALVMMFLMAGVFMPFFLGSALTLAFELVRSSVYYIVVMSILLPFLNIFVTLTAAKETAAFFRVDVSFMSFLKII
ncbi:MAG: hypothetical protein AB1295_03180 [Candidatus Micrarchaeota archaeon]